MASGKASYMLWGMVLSVMLIHTLAIPVERRQNNSPYNAVCRDHTNLARLKSRHTEEHTGSSLIKDKLTLASKAHVGFDSRTTPTSLVPRDEEPEPAMGVPNCNATGSQPILWSRLQQAVCEGTWKGVIVDATSYGCGMLSIPGSSTENGTTCANIALCNEGPESMAVDVGLAMEFFPSLMYQCDYGTLDDIQGGDTFVNGKLRLSYYPIYFKTAVCDP